MIVDGTETIYALTTNFVTHKYFGHLTWNVYRVYSYTNFNVDTTYKVSRPVVLKLHWRGMYTL